MKKAVFFVLLATSLARAEMYQWIDSNGTVNFTDSAASIPDRYRKNAKRLDIEMNNGTGSVSSQQIGEQMGEVKERLLHDEKSMELIKVMATDPQMQALVKDPALLQAVQSMDLATLLSHPGFLKLLQDPKVLEIQNRIKTGPR